MTKRRGSGWLIGLGIPIVVVGVIAAVWNWDWFTPMLASRASAAIGRQVRIGHLHVRIGRVSTVVADDVTVANPPNWREGPPLAGVPRLLVQIDLLDYLFHRRIVLPLIQIERPTVFAAELPNGQANYRLTMTGGSGSGSGAQIGDLRIVGGRVHALVPKLRADFEVAIDTREAPGREPELLATARGTYAGQPIEGRMIGGALLTLRDPTHPWPVDLRLANGPTQVELQGTMDEPLALGGARLRLRFAGPSMGTLESLTGIPIPATPPFELTGNLSFASHRVQFRDFAGRVGSSDLEGTIDVNPGAERPVVDAELQSRSVNLADLGGFIGTRPGGPHTPGESAAGREETARAEATAPKLLPTKTLNLPQFHHADVHLLYRGKRIQGRSTPLDDLAVALDIINGQITLHPLSFGIGVGRIKSDVRLTPINHLIHAEADIAFQSVDVARLMAATHILHGAGTISGSGKIVTQGNSLAAMAANGSGEIVLGMAAGNLSALLVDLSGLEFGNAVLSALGMPHQTMVECLVADFALQHGIMRTRALVLDTAEAVVNTTGTIDLRKEALDLQIRTAPKHFSIGSLPGPINIGGTFKHPSILPSAQTVARGAAAGALGVLLAPLAVLPTIQFGSSDHHRCDALLAEARTEAPGAPLPQPREQHSAR